MRPGHTRAVGHAVLRRLVEARGAVVATEALLYAAYGEREDGGPGDALGVLQVLLCRLRKRLPEGAIRTEWGVGYSLDPALAAALRGRFDDAHVVLARSPRDAMAFRKIMREGLRP